MVKGTGLRRRERVGEGERCDGEVKSVAAVAGVG